MRIALLDDYQDIAMGLADWASLPAGTEVVPFHDHLFDETAIAARLRGFDAVIALRERTPFPRSLLARLPDLKLLITAAMRNAVIDVPAARDHGILVCGTGGVASPTSELAWGLIIALARHIPTEFASVLSGGWQTKLGVGLEGRTLGIIGLGNLGGRMAAIAHAFDMNVIAWSQNLTAERAEAHGATLVTKEELLAQSDFVTIHLVLSDRTKGLISTRELSQMKPTAYLVNTSRGPIVDENALAAALRAHTIAGAGIDVFDIEPLPAQHPYLRLDNILVTPHIGYVTEERIGIAYRDAVEDVKAYLAGSPIRVIQP